jgi:hypothetical protein
MVDSGHSFGARLRDEDHIHFRSGLEILRSAQQPTKNASWRHNVYTVDLTGLLTTVDSLKRSPYATGTAVFCPPPVAEALDDIIALISLHISQDF